MAYFVGMHKKDTSRWSKLKKFEVTVENIVEMVGDYEIAECVSGDVFCIPIIPQQKQEGLLNSIATSILGQKVWGDCIQLNEEEYFKIGGKNRR